MQNNTNTNIPSQTLLGSHESENLNVDMDSSEAKNQKKKCNLVLILTVCFSIVIIVIVIALCVTFLRVIDDDKTVQDFEFVYINDIHLDPLYVSKSHFKSFTDCRKPSEDPSEVEHPFGQYGCDTSKPTFQSMLQAIPRFVSKKPQFILFGGDAPAHSLGYNISQTQDLIRSMVTDMSSMYSDIPLLFALGNNDFVPNYGNADGADDVNNFESIADILKPFMNEEQQKTFKKGGYYFHDFPEGKLRILILNTVIYNTRRTEQVDPYDQFAWIESVSKEAHEKGLKVGAVIHIPPGVTYSDGNNTNLNEGWVRSYIIKYDKIVKDNDIKFTIAGHSHYDMIVPLYGPNGVSKGYSLSAPAISSQHDNNPAFRIINYADGELKEIKQYFADIMMNPQKELNWELEYQFTTVYNVSDLSTESLQKVAKYVAGTPKGRWDYKARVTSYASENGKFYYCILTCTTVEEIWKCLGPINARESLNRYFPYGGEY